MEKNHGTIPKNYGTLIYYGKNYGTIEKKIMVLWKRLLYYSESYGTLINYGKKYGTIVNLLG